MGPLRAPDEPAARGRRLVAGALARAEAFLLEPVQEVARPAAIRLRPVVAVVALAPRCGTTTVARALAVELALADPGGAAVVLGDARAGRLAVGSAAAGRLERALTSTAAERVGVAGRLCLVEGAEPLPVADAVRHLAPLVVEVGHGELPGAPMSLADHAVVVGPPACEPALAAAVVASLGRIGPSPSVLLNRAAEGEPALDRWNGRDATLLRRSAGGARVALAGRSHRGALGSGIGALAERCSAVRSDW